jgi:hypothetical protein
MTTSSTGLASSACFTRTSVSCKSSGERSLSSLRKTSWRALAWTRAIAFSVAALMLLCVVCVPAQAQTLEGNWNQQSPATSAGARWQATMDYDAAQGQVVLFGGFSNGELGDTWLWNGTTWTQQSPATNPPARSQSAMVYDAAQSNVVLFGGYLSNNAPFRSADTWVWNGTTWAQQSPATSPSARADHAMAYDAAQGNVVLFGGFTDFGATLGDTWIWNGTTWTQQSPSANPTGRYFSAMAYDAVHNLVVMFGGDTSSGPLNDTWVWNGTNWTQLTPATSPTARYGHTMAFDAQTGQIVLFGGVNASNTYLNDTWVWDGTNWTQESPAASPVARAFHNEVYNAAQGQVVLFGGYDVASEFGDTWVWSYPGNFGNINVCPSGQSTPAPCSSTLAFTYSIATTTTFNTTPTVVTQGNPNLDFTLGSGNTCTGTISAGGTCTVNVKFAPLAPGLRLGAVQLLSSAGILLVSTPIYGNGQGPVVAFGLGTQTNVNTGSFTLNSPKGVTVDAAGNIYISDNSNQRVVKVPANGTPTTVGFNLQYPQGLAVDGAGDLFIADNNLNQVVEVPAGCTTVSCQTTVGTGLSGPLGVAVDGTGDVFIANFDNHEVVEVPANGQPQTLVYSAGVSSNPIGLAVDAAGDLFITDFGLNQVVKIPAGCTTSSCQTTVGTGWNLPEAIAVDAAGDVFVAQETAPYIVEVPAGCASLSCQITVSETEAFGVAVDAMGDIFIPQTFVGQGAQVFELNRAQPPTVTFPTPTNVGSSDITDGAMLTTLQNVGNTTLSFPVPHSGNDPSIGPDFSLFSNGAGDCPLITVASPAPGTLAPGAQCVYSVTFAPMTAGNLSESLTLTDNNFNAVSPSPAATQAILLTGTGVSASFTLSVSTAGSGSGVVSGTNCSSGSYPTGTTVTCTETPTAGSLFTGWSGGTCSGAGSCSFSLGSNSTVVANFTLAYTLTVTEVGTGSGTVTDNLAQISCSEVSGSVTGTCLASYASGTTVTLTASSTGTSTFVGWGGACTSVGASALCNVTMNSVVNVSASFVAPGASQSGVLKSITADVVYGQGGSFTSSAGNNGGISANSLYQPSGVVVDSSGNLYAADLQNSRVLFYPAGSTTATRVYGQSGSFATGGGNKGGISANSLNNPVGLALDSSGNLYVADWTNNRVLFYLSGSTTATRVYGQGGSFTSNASSNGGVSANSLNGPQSVVLDASGNLYVADTYNNRVLFYPAGSTTATQVYGQGGSLTSSNVNNGGISATSLNNPYGVALDSSGDLYVADWNNNRVLFYPFGSTTATQVYGQAGSFTSNTANNGGVSANSLYNPFGVAVDSSGNLYVADYSNNRALFYPFGSTTATRVYGQGGIFTARSGNTGANGLSNPAALALDSVGNLYAADKSGNRVLEYGSFGNVNVCPAGQSTPAPCNRTVSFSYNAAPNTSFGAIEVVTQGASNLDFTLASGSTCTGTTSAGGSCTVNVTFVPLAQGMRMGAVQLFDNGGNLLASAPAYGVGQGPAIAFGPATTYTSPFSFQSQIFYSSQVTQVPNLASPGGGLTTDSAGNLYQVSNPLGLLKVVPGGIPTTVATGFSAPQGVAIDGAGNFYVADQGLGTYGEVVKLAPGCASPTCASVVYAASASPGPYGVAVDGSGDVFISGSAIGVLEIPAGCSTSNCRIPLYSPGSGSNAAGVAVDAAGDVFIADSGLHQVVEIPAGCTTPGCQTTVGTGWVDPLGVAVDAAGDVLVADFELTIGTQIDAGGVVEVPAGCTNSNCQTLLLTAGAPDPFAVTVSSTGQIFAATDGPLFEINQSQPPSLTFALTNAGSTSTDSPKSVSVQNIGNQSLTGSLSLPDTNNFIENSSCGNSFTLSPGAICSVGFSFTPQTTGYLTDVKSFSDNTLNGSLVVQTVNLSGTSGQNGQAATVAVPNVVGMTQAAATTSITGTDLVLGTVSTASSDSVASGSVISSSPAGGTFVNVGSAVQLLVSTGTPTPPPPNPLSLLNNYFVTGDYASAGVTLRGKGHGGIATGTITIPSSTANPSATQGVPDGADIIDAYLYWETLENTPSPSSTSGTFNGYAITGQQIGKDAAYTDGSFSGTLRVYRANVNGYLPVATNGSGIRYASGAFTVSLQDGGAALPLTEGASLVVIYRVLSQNFPLKSVVIYDGSTIPASSGTQTMQGFYDALGGTAEFTSLYAASSIWNNNIASSVTLTAHANQYLGPLNTGNAYAAVILSTPVTNSDNDGILDAWKAGPAAGDFHAGQAGYYDVTTSTWVPLPGALHGEKDLFVQLDYMCGAVLANGSCDPTQENLYPSPDASGNDPLAMVTAAFAAHGVALHLEVGNAVPETTCTDNLTTTPPQLCQFPGQPGVIGWKNSLEFSKLWPRNFASCVTGGDCTTRYPYGQKDSYHYVLFGHSLAIPAWNTRYQTLTSITVASGVTTIVTVDRGTGINYCPSRITIAGVLGNPGLNGVYNTTGCANSTTITVATPGVPNWSYPNSTLPEPEIGLTSGTTTSISGYSDLGGADSAITLGLWLTYPNQDMSKRATVEAGTLFHEIGHTLGLTHGGLYYDGGPGSYVPTFEANCKPNYVSVMNYLFQLDLVGPNQAVDFSNQQLITLNESTGGSVTQLTDLLSHPATYSTSAWYVPYTTGTTASPATLYCNGVPISGAQAYRVNGSVSPITPAWSNGQDINYDGALNTQMRGYNDWGNIDLRQVGATGGEFASLATVLSFGSSVAPLNVNAGGNVAVGSGGTVALGSGGTVTLGSGGNVTLGSGGTITAPSGGGNVTLGNGGTVTLGSGGTVTPGSNGTVTLGSGGLVTLGSGGTVTLGSGGTVTLGSGGTVTLGSGGTIALGSGGSVTIPSTGGSYALPSNGGIITLGSGGNVTLGSGGNVTLGSGGTIALGSGGNVTLGSGGIVTLGSGGTIALGSGGNVTLGSGGNVTLGSGGTIALGSGGNVTLGSGGNVTLGSGGTVTLGSGGNVALGSGGNVTLGSGGSATLGAGGTVTLGSGGNVTLGSGGNVTLGSGGTVTMGSGGNITLGSGGTATVGSLGGTITPGSGGTVTLGSGGTVTLGSGGTIVLGSGGTVTLGSGGSYTLNSSGGVITPNSGGTVTLGSGGIVTLGSGGIVALGSGGNVTLGSGGNVTLGSGGTIALGSGGNITLGSGGTVTLGSGGNVTLGSGGNVTLGSGGNVTLGSGGTIALGSGGSSTLGSGGPVSTELTYETANSIVRPPPAATETPSAAGVSPAFVTVNWTAPLFGVVSTYTIYRSSDGATPIEIGSVSGVNGFPPATTFTDTNPDLTSKTVVYTITTTLVQDPTGGQRSSAPSPPAVLTVNQSISLGPVPSSVTLSTTPLTVTATAMSAGMPNGLQVNFSATGTCSIGSQSITSNVSSATVNLNSTGSCTVTASQPGNTGFNAASAVSGTFAILAQGSNTLSQTISFAPLQEVQYGNTFSLSASSSASLPVSFTPSGPCTISGTTGSTTGVGVCTVKASAPANSTYSAASVTQSFIISPAVLKVTAYNLTSVYGQPLPALTYNITGFVNGDTSSVVSGIPALSTTAASGSSAGSYPITVMTGTLAAANYDFLYVSGTLTITKPTLTITASSSSMIYGGPVPPITPTYNGFAPGQSASNLTTQPTCATAATSTSPVIASPYYVSTCSGAVDSNYTITYVAGSVAVTQASTTTAVTSSGNPSTFMQMVTFTATVTPQYTGTTPTGTVTFYNTVNGVTTTLGTGTLSVLNGVDVATFSTATLQDTYSNSITAVYGGDSNFTGSNDTTSPLVQTVSPAPNVSLSPMFISFGNQNVNTKSSAATVTLTNIGDATLNISTNGISINPSTDTQFTQTNNCGSSVAATKSCTITITFTPVDTGTQTASLQITDNDDDTTGAQQIVSLTGAGLSTIKGGSLYTDAIFAGSSGCGSITGSGNGSVDSFSSALGYNSSHVLSGGNVGTNGNVTVSGNSTIYGTAAVDVLTTGNCSKTSVTGVTTNGNAKVTGGLVALNGPITYPTPPAPKPAPPTTSQTISGTCPSGMSGCTNGPGSKTVTLAPGSYGNVQLSGGTTVDLSGGTYNLNSLVLSGNSILSVVGSSPVLVNLAGASLSGGSPALDLSGGSMENPTAIPANLQFTYAGSQGVNLSGGSSSYATVYAPNAIVNMSGNADFYGSIIASTLTNGGNGALHYDTSLPDIKSGNYIWFNAVVNNLKNLGSGQVKLYVTNSTISFTANNTTYNVAVPNSVVTFNSASQTSGAKTIYDLTNNRWSTAVAASALTGNTFVTAVAFPVPSNFPTGIQNVTWSAAFTTDSPGVTLQWQWGAAVYSSFSTTYATTSNSNILSVNAEDGSADSNGTDPAGTPEAYKGSVVFGGTGGGLANYTGYLSSGAGVVPTIAPMSVSPSSLAFAAQNQHTTSAAMTAILTNNDAVAHTISSVALSGTNAGDFASTNNCPISPSTLAAGSSCTISVTFTPTDVGSRTAKVVVNDDANNSPQTLYLSGTGQ